MNISREPGERLFRLGDEGDMELECPMTEAERAALNAQVAGISAETFAVEEEKKAAVQPLNKKLTDLKARERDALAQLSKGTVQRVVRTRRVGDFFRGEAWVERLDGEEPQEVEGTRCALTEKERQTVLPGVVVDGRPSAQVLDLFSRSAPSETKKPEASKPEAPAPEGPQWQAPLEGFAGWRVEESTGKAGERLYLLTNDARAFGPFRYEDGFHLPDASDGLPEDVCAAISSMFRDEVASGLGEVANRFVVSAEDAVEERLQSLAGEASASATAPSASSEDSAEGPRVGKLYELGGFPGWGLYVHEGHAYLRRPNVASFEPAASPQDVGPFGWNAKDKMLDAVPGAKVGDDWLNANGRLLEEADALVSSGKVTEKVVTLPAVPTATREPEPSLLEDPYPADADATPKEDSETDGEAPAGGASDVETLARKLSDAGRKVVKLLAGTDAPTDSESIGNRTHTKAGSVLNGLVTKGLVEKLGLGDGATWRVTEMGREVAAELVRLAESKGKKPSGGASN